MAANIGFGVIGALSALFALQMLSNVAKRYADERIATQRCCHEKLPLVSKTPYNSASIGCPKELFIINY
jgi:hypothetical protein